MAVLQGRIKDKMDTIQQQQSLQDELERERGFLVEEEKALLEQVFAVRRDIEQVWSQDSFTAPGALGPILRPPTPRSLFLCHS